MSCSTKQSVNKDLKDLILAENWKELGIKSRLNTSSAKSSSYTDGRIEIFIPYDTINPNKNVLFGKVKNLESQINDKYKSEKYGNIISIQQPKDGMVISISSTNKLIDALNQQYDGQRNIPDIYFHSRENLTEDNSLEELQAPITDNFLDLVMYKKAQLEKVEKDIKYLSSKLTNKNKEIRKEKYKEKKLLENQIIELTDSNNTIEFMYNSVFTQLEDIKNSIENGTIDFDKINSEIQFL